jgi:hypothetical protein
MVPALIISVRVRGGQDGSGVDATEETQLRRLNVSTGVGEFQEPMGPAATTRKAILRLVQ